VVFVVWPSRNAAVHAYSLLKRQRLPGWCRWRCQEAWRRGPLSWDPSAIHTRPTRCKPARRGKARNATGGTSR